MNSGELSGALKDANEAVRIQPKSALAFFVRGAIFRRRGELDRALEDLNETVALDPQNLSACCLRGLCWDELGKFDLAIVDFRNVLSHGSKNPVVPCMLALSLARKGDFPAAIAHLDEAIARSPDFGRGYLERAELFCATRRYDLALNDLETAAQNDSSLEESAAAQRSWIRSTCPDSKYLDGHRAIEDAERVLHTNREPKALNDDTERVGSILMAAALAETGDFDSAILRQKKAIEIYKRERDRNRSNSHDDGLAWLEKVMRSFENHKAYREEPADSKLANTALRQPQLIIMVKSLRHID
jgi:tetratricopeptide (TPR) repeat protein